MALLIALRYVAAAVVDGHLRAEIERIKLRGEPIAPADFAEPKLADDENAAVPLVRAGFMVRILPQEDYAWSFLPEAVSKKAMFHCP